MASIWQLFGLERVTSGLVIRALNPESAKVLDEDEWSYYYPEAPQTPEAPLPEPDEFDIALLPTDLQAAMVIDKPVRVITLGESAFAPEGYVNATPLAREHGVPLVWLHSRFDRAGFSYQGMWPRDGSENQEYERWYEPAVMDYLQENPIPKLAEATQLTAREIGKLYGVSAGRVRTIAGQLRIEPLGLLGRTGRDAKCYDFAGFVAIAKKIEATPDAAKDDEPYFALTQELSEKFVVSYVNKNGIKPIDKRRHPDHGKQGYCEHITAAEAKKIRTAYYRLAGDSYIGFSEMAALAGVAIETIIANLSPAAEAALTPARKSLDTRPVDMLPRELGLAEVERIKPKKLPWHLVTLNLINARIPRDRALIYRWLEERGYKKESRQLGQGRPSACYPWAALQALEEQFGFMPGATTIDYEKVLQGPDDTDNNRARYSYGIQACYLKLETLTLPPERRAGEPASQPTPDGTPPPEQSLEQDTGEAALWDDVILSALMAASKSPAGNRRLLSDRDGREQRPNLAGIPIKPNPAAQPQKPTPSPKPHTPPPIPEHYVPLRAFLAEKNAACDDSNLVSKLAKRHKVSNQVATKPNGEIMASKEAASAIALSVLETPIAAPGMLTPAQLAAPFQQQRVTANDIAYFAAQFTTAEVATKDRRVRNADDTPGPLSIHYEPGFAQRLEKRLQAMAEHNQLHVITKRGRLPR